MCLVTEAHVRRSAGRHRAAMHRASGAAEAALEHACWDPKDGELCLGRMKPEETLVEVRSGTDVQIVRRIWV